MIMCLAVQEFLYFDETQFTYLCLLLLMLSVSYLRIHCQSQGYGRYHLFSSKSSMILVHVFMLFDYFELTFVCGMRYRSKFIFLHLGIHLSQHHLLKIDWCVGSFWTLNSIPPIYVSTKLFWLLQLCSTFWNWEIWVFWLCSFSSLFWLLGNPFNSTWIWGLTSPFLQKRLLGFW